MNLVRCMKPTWQAAALGAMVLAGIAMVLAWLSVIPGRADVFPLRPVVAVILLAMIFFVAFCRLKSLLLRQLSDRQKQLSERNLIQVERLCSFIIDCLPYSIIAMDKDGRIIRVNKAALRMLWYEETELVDRFTMDMLHDPSEIRQRAVELSNELGYEIAPGFEVFVAKARAGLLDEHEWTYVRKGGTRLPVRVSLTELRDSKFQVHGYLSVASDITEQKRSEELVRHITLHDALTGLPNRDRKSTRLNSSHVR